LAWADGSFDDRTNALFREWVDGEYDHDIGKLNDAWGTEFASFDDIDPRDRAIFDYESHPEGRARHPQAVEDHVEFRSQMVNRGLRAIKDRVRETYPNVLIATELPYQLASHHPHGIGYRVGYGANPSSTCHAEILFSRMTGPMNAREREVLAGHIRETGQKVILCYRTYRDWGTPVNEGGPDPNEIARLYADEAAQCAHGIGFYSWNEMVDCHLAPPGEGSPMNDWTVQGEMAERMQRQAWDSLRTYRALHK
jgi:hypothetical protein